QRWEGGTPPGDSGAYAMGGGVDGMLSDYVLLEETGTVKLPHHFSAQEGATLPCAGLTAWNAGVEHGNTKAGQTVLVQGTGGVSIFALQFARMLGAEVIATSSSDEKLAHAKKLGAAHGINYKTTPDWDKAAVEITRGGVDQVVEVGGAGTFTRSLGAIKSGGEISGMLILGKRANIQGISVGSTQMFEAMNRAISVNAMKPVIDKVFPFADAKAAFHHLQSQKHVGKVVISLA